METLPIELIRVVASFLSIQEFGLARQTWADFDLPCVRRRKRFHWCVNNIPRPQHLSNGPCVHHLCERFKAACISWPDGNYDTPNCKVLSNYCSTHHGQHAHVALKELLDLE
ncbi:hypothetical protein N9A45_01850 [bacterium]|nr:hypothetical protein [bacterium]